MTEVIYDLADCYYNKLNKCIRNNIILNINDSSQNGCIYYDKIKINSSKDTIFSQILANNKDL